MKHDASGIVTTVVDSARALGWRAGELQGMQPQIPQLLAAHFRKSSLVDGSRVAPTLHGDESLKFSCQAVPVPSGGQMGPSSQFWRDIHLECRRTVWPGGRLK